MKKIPLRNGKFCLLDDEDYEELSKHKWYLNGSGSVIGRMKRGAGPLFHMHRIIMNPPIGMMVDHINGDRLDNRKCNLRVATASENARNAIPQKNCKSGIKGVYWRPEKKRWRAVLRIGDKIIIDRMFKDIEMAAKARRLAAIQHQGEFAYENRI